MKKALTIFSIFLLVSCSGDNSGNQSDTTSLSASVIGSASNTTVRYAEFNTSITIRDVMNTLCRCDLARGPV
jgi:uncharacterized protein YcfL